MNSTLIQIGEKIKEIRPVSVNSMKILKLISDPDYDINNLEKLIAMDVSLTVNFLKIVNSASVGVKNPVTSIKKAISYLGTKSVMNLIMSKDFSGIFEADLEGYQGDVGDLWDHSLRTAISSRHAAYLTDNSDLAEIVYTAGLLHDIGKVVISDFINLSEGNLTIDYKLGEEEDFIEIEEKILKTNHCEVGQLIAMKWGIPEILQQAIRYHHAPSKAPDEYKMICILVHLGDIFSVLGGFSTGVDALAYRIDDEAKRYMKVKYGMLEKILFEIDMEYNDSQKLLHEFD